MAWADPGIPRCGQTEESLSLEGAPRGRLPDPLLPKPFSKNPARSRHWASHLACTSPVEDYRHQCEAAQHQPHPGRQGTKAPAPGDLERKRIADKPSCTVPAPGALPTPAPRIPHTSTGNRVLEVSAGFGPVVRAPLHDAALSPLGFLSSLLSVKLQSRGALSAGMTNGSSLEEGGADNCDSGPLCSVPVVPVPEGLGQIPWCEPRGQSPTACQPPSVQLGAWAQEREWNQDPPSPPRPDTCGHFFYLNPESE